ncbi:MULTISPECIES: DUF22 domain-containing protein [Archaeoglobus]|uniref:DUF22 domain-containing protein n=1 Tax=Archaeoglobus fulgidus TaxID=2234 RepID=A0A117KLK4_ARCFL|nr:MULTISPECIES: DUF22 domain-containing protein [Archaeoglobus]KUJ92850.1 MAG: hypothetical protein XD40_1967 [Archaeoglobus fulgidus]KUK06306.1 MAG: hypothetical protein XD48_1471 [Archaeoglobus fulgidus]MDI3498265.1 hypothetical protein [Archaeoglobus sp.]
MIDGDIINSMREVIPKELSIIGRWELIIADEDKKLLRGFSILRIREIPIPPNSIIIPVNVLRHSSVEIVDLLISDRGGEINTAVVFSESGKVVRKGEILGVVKISDTAPKEEHKILEVFRDLKRKLDEMENEFEESFLKPQWPVI